MFLPLPYALCSMPSGFYLIVGILAPFALKKKGESLAGLPLFYRGGGLKRAEKNQR
jgi:hypothetical protein